MQSQPTPSASTSEVAGVRAGSLSVTSPASRPASFISVEESSGPELSERNQESEDDGKLYLWHDLPLTTSGVFKDETLVCLGVCVCYRDLYLFQLLLPYLLLRTNRNNKNSLNLSHKTLRSLLRLPPPRLLPVITLQNRKSLRCAFDFLKLCNYWLSNQGTKICLHLNSRL